MHVCMCMFTHIVLYFLHYLQKTFNSLKKRWPLPEGPEMHMSAVPLGRSCVFPLPLSDPHWQWSRPGQRPGPRSPEISTFYTIIKQWEFDHVGLLECCVASSTSSSDSNSTSNASYGSVSVVCTHRKYSLAKGSTTMYALCVQRGEEVKCVSIEPSIKIF